MWATTGSYQQYTYSFLVINVWHSIEHPRKSPSQRPSSCSGAGWLTSGGSWESYVLPDATCLRNGEGNYLPFLTEKMISAMVLHAEFRTKHSRVWNADSKRSHPTIAVLGWQGQSGRHSQSTEEVVVWKLHEAIKQGSCFNILSLSLPPSLLVLHTQQSKRGSQRGMLNKYKPQRILMRRKIPKNGVFSDVPTQWLFEYTSVLCNLALNFDPQASQMLEFLVYACVPSSLATLFLQF